MIVANELKPQSLNSLLPRSELGLVHVKSDPIFLERFLFPLKIFSEQPQVISKPIFIGLKEPYLLAIRLILLRLVLKSRGLSLKQVPLYQMPFQLFMILFVILSNLSILIFELLLLLHDLSLLVLNLLIGVPCLIHPQPDVLLLHCHLSFELLLLLAKLLLHS